MKHICSLVPEEVGKELFELWEVKMFIDILFNRSKLKGVGKGAATAAPIILKKKLNF